MSIRYILIPKWDELVEFVDEIMNAIPDYVQLWLCWLGFESYPRWMVRHGRKPLRRIHVPTYQWARLQKEFEELIGWSMIRLSGGKMRSHFITINLTE